MMPEGPYHIDINFVDNNNKRFVKEDGDKVDNLKFTWELYRMDMKVWENHLKMLHDDLRVIVRPEVNIYITVRYHSPGSSSNMPGTWPSLCSYYGPEKRFVDHYSS